MTLWSRIQRLFSRSEEPASCVASDTDADDKFWQRVYSAREEYFQRHVGPLPDNILKIGHMFGVWPGGGLFVIPAQQIGDDIFAHTTFGFTNSDMPASTTVSDVEVERDELGRVTKTSSRLQAKSHVPVANGKAGYGYEIMLLTRGTADWPLWFLQWAAGAELLNDTGILGRVEKYNGLTIEQIRVGESETVNVLIAKAVPPLPTGTELPNGRMDIIVATVITDDEMQWSMENRRDALLERLQTAGIGQISDRNRASVLR